MSNTIATIDYEFISPGDLICTPIDSVFNSSGTTVDDVKVVIDVPDGVVFDSYNVTQGLYNSLNNEWQIGTMRVNQTVSGVICWRVTDDCLAPYKFDLIAVSAGGSLCIGEEDLNSGCIVVKGLTTCQVTAKKRIITITDDYTITSQDRTILLDASVSPIVVTLPPASMFYSSSKSSGHEWEFKVIDFNNSIEIESTSKLLDNTNLAGASTSYSFGAVGEWIKIQSAGSFYVIKR
ncbi:hypothetical protein KC573_03545 [candidate division WWE3 bacterium]|uniref:DUF11 domain-containing protein n=1 Tax=candidate division WWE3 bacterium TaxID=2053526 RepID=A0A955LWL6_UNCKA|nr:hypothetical protein [candidate division WWE3 bacterium]